MSHPAEGEFSAPRASAIPSVLGLLALAVLALAFVGALFGSVRNAKWREGENKAEVAGAELARIEFVIVRSRELLVRRAELRGRLPSATESSLRVTQLVNLVERYDSSPVPAIPERGSSRLPTGAQLEALELWLDDGYRRIAAGRDVESRLSDLEAEIAALQASVDASTAARR